jgi:N-acetylmuramoyl-L-alanine amidase
MNPAEVRGVAVHYSGMNADEQRLHTKCAARVRGMQRFHMEQRGWLDIAYNHVFCRHGYVFVGRSFGVRSAANGTNEANDRYFAACFLGDDSKGRADVAPEARRALEQLIAEYRRRYPRARAVRPHSDFVATACPGDELRALISAL